MRVRDWLVGPLMWELVRLGGGGYMLPPPWPWRKP